MSKSGWRRISLEFLQLLLALVLFFALATLMLNSYIEVNSIDGNKTYKIFPADQGQDFEDSEVYRDLFQSAVSDITQLVALKGYLETDGALDPAKKIDVLAYAQRISANNGGTETAVFELDDLIKWSKHGVDYQNYQMTVHEFVNYFGYVIYPENFTLDEYDQLMFDGFYRVGSETLDTGELYLDSLGEPILGKEPAYYGKTQREVSVVYEKMQDSGISEREFENMIFAYIMSRDLKGITLLNNDEVSAKLRISFLNERYHAYNASTDLVHSCDNWVDYLLLQDNIIKTIESIGESYTRYQLSIKSYQANNSNVKYMVRVMTEEGMKTYTNIPDLEEASDETVTEMISEYQRYLIYYPDNLVFTGNTIMSEDEIYNIIQLYDYKYPDTAHIWIGVDTGYSVVGDAFYNANLLYTSVVPYIWQIMAVLIVVFLLWLGIGIFLTITCGVTTDEEGNKKYYLNYFDHSNTEILLVLSALFVLGVIWGYHQLVNIAETASFSIAEFAGMRMSRVYQYAAFLLYGIYINIGIGIIWFSFVRRWKSKTIWKGSICRIIGKGLGKVGEFLFSHSNAVVRVLIPYNLYIFLNILGIVGLYRFREERWKDLAVLILCVLFNVIIGVFLCKRAAERNRIVEGINRIRAGEVDYTIDTEAMHGENRDLAHAVNNIGDGIRTAVKTNMKDEQMKADLITNVSHDIKTPLTSIINYVDLLRRLNINEEPAKGYIKILDNKARRLKQLTDDLVEASKISSGNIELKREKINLTELVNQGVGELSDKLEEHGLTVVFEARNAYYIYADSRRMWRIVENLMNNVCKYAMENTRVYIDIERENGKIHTSIKNISRQQMNIKPEELTERFIRGDSARSTEGSGLGLFIADNLTKAQDGDFKIYLDGDLFKVTFSFDEYVAPKVAASREEDSLPIEINVK